MIELTTPSGEKITVLKQHIMLIVATRRDTSAPAELILTGLVNSVPVQESYDEVRSLLAPAPIRKKRTK